MHTCEVNYNIVICNERDISLNTITITKRDHTANLQNIQHAQYM